MRLRDEIAIDASTPAVWRVLTDLDRAPRYVPYLVRIERLGPDGRVVTEPEDGADAPLAPGTRVRMTLGVAEGQALDIEAEVVEVEAPRTLLVRGAHDGHGVTAEIRWRLTDRASDPAAAGAGSLLRQEVAITFRSMVMRLGAKAMVGRAERELRAGLERFKAIVEQEEVASNEGHA